MADMAVTSIEGGALPSDENSAPASIRCKDSNASEDTYRVIMNWSVVVLGVAFLAWVLINKDLERVQILCYVTGMMTVLYLINKAQRWL